MPRVTRCGAGASAGRERRAVSTPSGSPTAIVAWCPTRTICRTSVCPLRGSRSDSLESLVAFFPSPINGPFLYTPRDPLSLALSLAPRASPPHVLSRCATRGRCEKGQKKPQQTPTAPWTPLPGRTPPSPDPSARESRFDQRISQDPGPRQGPGYRRPQDHPQDAARYQGFEGDSQIPKGTQARREPV